MRLFLCEKPSQGKDIARVLGASQRGSGYYGGPGITVTWCIGHLIEAAPPEAYGEHYRHWSIEQLPILPERWRSEVKASTAAQFKIVKRLVEQAGELVIATDADREGEMIAREIIDLCGYRGPIQRLWLSALNDVSIRKALDALRPAADTLPLYFSALARSRADWLVGMNLSRLFTVLGRQAGYGGVLSVGRVQTNPLSLGACWRWHSSENVCPCRCYAVPPATTSAPSTRSRFPRVRRVFPNLRGCAPCPRNQRMDAAPGTVIHIIRRSLS